MRVHVGDFPFIISLSIYRYNMITGERTADRIDQEAETRDNQATLRLREVGKYMVTNHFQFVAVCMFSMNRLDIIKTTNIRGNNVTSTYYT